MTLPHALPAPAGDFSCPLALVAPDECARIGDLLDQSLSDRTRAVYRSAWARFADWYLKRGMPSLPAAPVVLAAYFSYLFNDLGRTVTTVRLQRSAITSAHRLSGISRPGRRPRGCAAAGRHIPIPSLAPPRFNMWSSWSDGYLDKVANRVRDKLAAQC